MSKYTWVITRERIQGDASNVVGVIGPSGAKGRARFDVVVRKGDRFRLRTDVGHVEFSGYILGDYDGTEPLDDFGQERGCTDIEYERAGKWVTLEEARQEPLGVSH